MKQEQNEHLAYILSESKKLIADKYRAGAKEHQSVLSEDYTVEELLDMWQEEMTDGMTYGITLRSKLKNWKCKHCEANYVNNEMLCWEHSGGVSSGR